MSKIKNNTTGLQAILDAVNDLPDAGTGDYDVYKGTYTVTQSVERQILDTSNKLLQADVLVEEIPYAEVTNNSGGKTATIGGN